MGRFWMLAGAALLAATALIFLIKRMVSTMAERYRLPSGQFPSTKGALLLLLPVPVLIAAIIALAEGRPGALIGNAAGYALLLTGALLLRRGLLAAGESERRLAAKPSWPSKIFGSTLIALGTGFTAWLGVGHHLLIGGAFGLVALLGCYLCYGFDSPAAKRLTDRDGIDITEQVLRALEQAESRIAAIEETSRDIRNAELNARLRRIVQLARDILKLLESDPRGLRRARKFLNVYLDGAQKVTEGYAKTHARVAAPELDDNFRRVLTTIEEVFQEQQQKLLETDVTDLDVQIEVLATQLKREGVV